MSTEPFVDFPDVINCDTSPVSLLTGMLTIRRFEEMLCRLSAEGKGPGTCTSVGQEAVIGVVRALAAQDYILTNHRSAGHLIARGAHLGKLLAEVMGKQDGYCQGKSGTLHISAKALGVVLTSTIVGAELSMATGTALSQQMLGGDGISACFFGDGAACQGRFHESLNLAAVWQLPVLYVCENNQWQAWVHRRETMLTEQISQRAAAYGMSGVSVDGNDAEAVLAAAQQAIAQVRSTRKPVLLELLTYRMRGHFEPDDQAYVNPQELAAWATRDPIEQLSTRLLANGVLTAQAWQACQQQVDASLEQALAFANASPYPSFTELTRHVYA